MTITPDWAQAIQAFLDELTAAGKLPTTVRARREQLQHLARRVDVGPWAIGREHLVAYMAAQTWARETRRSRCAAVTAFYEWALACGLVDVDPTAGWQKIRPGDPNPSPVPDRVYLEALIRADADEALWIDLAAEHGLRRAEIAQLHSRDLVETLLGHDLVVHGKGGKLRSVPLTHAMARALLARPAGWMWPGCDGGHISPRWLGKRVNRLLDGEWTIHKLRHRAATRFWVIAEGDSYAVADLMGWASLNMVRVYVAQPNNRLRRIVEGASRTGPSVRDSLTAESRGAVLA